MGMKEDKLSNDAALSAELANEKNGSIPGVTSKKMFGGFDIFQGGKMFALVNSKGEVYLKFNDSIRSNFDQLGAHQHVKMPYFSVSDTVKYF